MSILSKLILNDCTIISNQSHFKEIKGKSFLITGGSGLIGHYLIATLNLVSSLGYKPSKVSLVYQNSLPLYFDDLTHGLNVEFIQGDLTNDEFLGELPNADYIIHAAGYGQPGKFMTDKIKTIELNTKTTIATLNKLNLNGKYIFLSTSEVYNGLVNAPFDESQIGTTNPENIRACYIEGKRCGEAIVNSYRSSKGINAKSVRLSLAYGPGTRKDDARVINNFIQKAIIHKKIELLDEGTSMRTYLYVRDAVDIIYKILFNGESNLYNLGGESRISILNLANYIASILNVQVVLPKTSNGMSDAPIDVFLNMNRVKSEFGISNFVQFEEGIIKTIEWQIFLYTN